MFGHFGNRHFPGEVGCAPQVFDLVGELRQQMAATRTLDDGAHELVLSCAQETLPVRSDPGHIECIVMNLLQNATRYSPAGSRIEVAVESTAQGPLIRVSDAGVGIPAADLERIYAPHFRGSNVRDRAGTGLGLAIVRQSAQAIGARISVRSTVGAGTVFTVALAGADVPPAHVVRCGDTATASGG